MAPRPGQGQTWGTRHSLQGSQIHVEGELRSRESMAPRSAPNDIVASSGQDLRADQRNVQTSDAAGQAARPQMMTLRQPQGGEEFIAARTVPAKDMDLAPR